MKKLAALLALLGTALLCYSLTLLPYKNEQAFMQQYLAMNSGQSAEYFALREAQLTAKYMLQDIGIEALLFGVLGVVLARNGELRINSFRSRAVAVTAAFALPVVFVAGYVFDLVQAFDRGEFPHWADSMGIPMMGAPVILVFLWLWAFGNIVLSSGRHLPNLPISTAFQWRRNWWQLANAALWLLMAAIPSLSGQYWYAVPSLAWAYFFLSIGASRNSSYNGKAQ